MLRKLGVAGLVAGAAFGAVLAGSPASAHSGGHSFEQESVVVAGQECEASLASGVLALSIPILSPPSNGNWEVAAVCGNCSEYVFVLSSAHGVVPCFPTRLSSGLVSSVLPVSSPVLLSVLFWPVPRLLPTPVVTRSSRSPWSSRGRSARPPWPPVSWHSASRSCPRRPTVTGRSLPSAVTAASTSLFFRPHTGLFPASLHGSLPVS